MANLSLKIGETRRQEEIIEFVNKRGHATVEEIAEKFSCSLATARRDISKLDQAGRLRKVRNGCSTIDFVYFNSWLPAGTIGNNIEVYKEKVRIARRAASLCDENDSVIVNCGSTAFILGHELCGKPIHVVTNYFPLLNYLITRGHPSINVIGGQYQEDRNLFVSSLDDKAATAYSCHYMFTSGSGLTVEGLYKSDTLSSIEEKQLLKQVSKLVCLVDSTKIGSRVGKLFASPSQIDVVITGVDADPQVVASLEAQGVLVYLV